MSTTPIFDQLCQELGDVIEPAVSTEEINLGSYAIAEPEPELAPNLEDEMAEWSASAACWDTVNLFDELPSDSNER